MWEEGIYMCIFLKIGKGTNVVNQFFLILLQERVDFIGKNHGKKLAVKPCQGKCENKTHG